MNQSNLRIGLAANRVIGFRVLQMLQAERVDPIVLLVAKGTTADEWTERMVDAVDNDTLVMSGKTFREHEGVEQMRALELDYLISVHFPYIVPPSVLQLPRVGTLNLHPAYLPYNRGWHTPSWAIADGTPYGATLHWMDEGVDTGDIALQREIHVGSRDTAHSLYQRVLDLELNLFRDALPLLRAGRLPRIPQNHEGTSHRKRDLSDRQALQLHQVQPVQETLRQLRALTTSSWDEAAYFEDGGQRYRVQVVIRPETAEQQRAA